MSLQNIVLKEIPGRKVLYLKCQGPWRVGWNGSNSAKRLWLGRAELCDRSPVVGDQEISGKIRLTEVSISTAINQRCPMAKNFPLHIKPSINTALALPLIMASFFDWRADHSKIIRPSFTQPNKSCLRFGIT